MTHTTSAPPETLKGDILTGVREIARFLDMPERTCFNLLNSGQLPGAFKLGHLWHARRSTLLRGIEAREKGAA